MEQQTGSKLGKEYIKAVYCHPAYLTYMQSTWCEMPGWMKHKMESRLPGEKNAFESVLMRWMKEIKWKVKSLSHVQLFATLWTVAYQAPPDHGILQARILEWVAISFSRRSSQPRDQTQGSNPGLPHLEADALTSEPPGKP